MFNEKFKKSLFFFIFAIVILTCSSFANQYSLNVTPKQINVGDTVSIEYIGTKEDRDYKIEILLPSGKSYSLIPNRKSVNKYQVLFAKTYDKGFLTDNWNQYKVKLYNSKKLCIDSTYFFLNKENKTLFFTVYIDDIGKAGYLNKDGEIWFKSLGGKINYGYQHDDKGGFSLNKILQRYNNKDDYIFHHFHAWKFSGNKFILKLDHLLKWNHNKHLLNNFLRIQLRDRHYLIITFFLLIVFAILWLYKKNRGTKFILIVSVLLFLIIIIGIKSGHYVSNSNNWEIKLGDPEWSKKFLLNAKQEFEKNNMKYPEITRHGWNCPPRGLNKFYLTKMGVIADASIIYQNVNKYTNIDREGLGVLLNQVSKFSYKWPEEILLPLPYYTNIDDEINTLWDGKEEYRGVLEMPLTVDNICTYGFDENDRRVIDRLPNGALVSTYIHPGQGLSKLNGILTYIDENYNILFTTARDYLEMYLKYYPRPVLIDLPSKKAYWAYLEDNNITPISENDIIKVDNGTININSRNFPPYLGIIGKKYNLMELEKIYEFIGIINNNINLYKFRK